MNNVDKKLDWFKNHPVWSMIIVACLIIMGVGGVVSSLDSIGTVLSKLNPRNYSNATNAVSPTEKLTEQKKDRIRARLNHFLGEISVYINYQIMQDDFDAFTSYYQRAMRTVNDCSSWIDQEIGFSAREVFINRKALKKISFKNTISRYKQLFSDLEAYSAGLKELIKDDNWLNYYTGPNSNKSNENAVRAL